MVNLVLDLDETLIHTIQSDVPRKDLERYADFSFQIGANSPNFYVFKRPGLREFLETVFEKFKRVGIWTAADSLYAKAVLKRILTYEQMSKLDFVFSRGFCDSDVIGFVKPLQKIFDLAGTVNKDGKKFSTWNPEETIQLDNCAQVMKLNLRNGIVAPDYKPPHLDHDIYLKLLTDIFKESLPKQRVHQFVERVNNITPYLNSLYEMSQNHSGDRDNLIPDLDTLKSQLRLRGHVVPTTTSATVTKTKVTPTIPPVPVPTTVTKTKVSSVIPPVPVPTTVTRTRVSSVIPATTTVTRTRVSSVIPATTTVSRTRATTVAPTPAKTRQTPTSVTAVAVKAPPMTKPTSTKPVVQVTTVRSPVNATNKVGQPVTVQKSANNAKR
jgi:hypothetical protein